MSFFAKDMHTKTNKTPLEKDVQNTICEYLLAKNYFFWRNNVIPVFGRNNGGKMAFRSMGKYAMKGLPDIIIIINGKFVGIEVKRQGIDALRPEQIHFRDKCIENNTYYIVVHSLEELVEGIKKIR